MSWTVWLLTRNPAHNHNLYLSNNRNDQVGPTLNEPDGTLLYGDVRRENRSPAITFWLNRHEATKLRDALNEALSESDAEREHKLVGESRDALHLARCRCGFMASVVDHEAAEVWLALHRYWPDESPAELATRARRADRRPDVEEL